MFNWLKKLVQKKDSTEEPRQEEVAIDNLKKWFSLKTEKRFEKIKNIILEHYSRIEDIKNSVIENIGKLEKAELMNKNLPEKALQIMQGNKLSYIEKTKSFLDRISLPSEINLATTVEFCRHVDESLSELAKSNMKAYAIMQEFFSNESKMIAMNIKSIEETISRIKDLTNRKGEDLTKADETAGLIDEFLRLKKLSITMKRDFMLYEEQLKIIEQKDSDFNKRIEKLMNSSDYSLYNKKQEEIKNIENDIEKVKESVHELFSPLKKAMKKYEHICFENKEVLIDYNKDETEALQKDADFKIISVLQNLKKSIEQGDIEIKDKQKEKAVSAIESVEKEKLAGFVELIKKAGLQIDELKENLSGLAINDAIRDVEYRKQHLRDKEKRILIEMEKLKRMLAKINLEELEKRVLRDIKDSINIDVVIKKPIQQTDQSNSSEEETENYEDKNTVDKNTKDHEGMDK